MRLALKFAYDGKKFIGYARQKNFRTVESDIIKALYKLNAIDNIKKCKFQSASRTDRNVSALGNVIAFNTNFSYENIIKALNANLKDIWFYAKKGVAYDFNPRFATQRFYRYLVYKDNLKIPSMRRASKQFVGKHDFSSFAKRSEKKPVRKIDSIKLIPKGLFLIIDIKAESFLWHQVRKIVTALQKVGLQELEIEDLKGALLGKKKLELAPASAENLILVDIKYDFEFEFDKRAVQLLKKFWVCKFESLEAERSVFEKLLQLTASIGMEMG
jgi:tRNA pseudouridine38-40 synthase